jgi:hypothetical protein
MNKSPKAVITGASSGIGRELACLAAEQGFDLLLIARNLKALGEVKQEIEKRRNVQIELLAVDLSESNAVEEIAARLSTLRWETKLLINNAGYGLYGEFKGSDLAATENMLLLNTMAPTRLLHVCLPGLLATKGSVINVASTAAFQPGPFMAAYYASKAYLLSLSEAVAEELAAHGVHVMALCPGPTASGFQARADMAHSALVKNKKLPTAATVAAGAMRALKHGKRVYIPGWLNWLMAQSIRFTPRFLVTKIVRMLSRPV